MVTIDDFLNSVGVDETVRSELAALTVPDELADWNEGQSGLDPAEVDIVASVTFEASLGPGFLAQFPACGEGLICASDAASEPGTSIGPPGDYYVYLMQARGPIIGVPASDLSYYELGVVNFDLTPGGGGDPEPLDFGPNNFLTGSNTAYSVRFFVVEGEHTSLMVRLAHGDSDDFFHSEDSSAFAVARGGVVAVFIPEEEWSGAAEYRLFTYYQTQAGAAVTDTVPDMTDPMTPYDPTTTTNIALP